MNEVVRLAAPWTIFYRQVQVLFKKDPEIKVWYDERETKIKLYIDNADKAEALTKLLPEEKQFGNVNLKIEVVSGTSRYEDTVSYIEEAFRGNEAVSEIKVVETIFGQTFVYVVFKKEVVQFFNDDLTDLHGICSTLYQDIAKEVFGYVDGVFFCTAIDDNARVGMPLGEWP